MRTISATIVGPVLLGTVLVPAQANARDYYYFNKPSVSREAYVADIGECTELAGGARAPASGPTYVSVPNTQYGLYGVAVASLFVGLLSGGENKRFQRSVERTCMADKGYVRMEADKPLIREIETMKDGEERTNRLFGLAASEKPVGTRMSE